jgi:hypothetical protein
MMYANIATRIEIFFLDLFIYVLSESKLFRTLIQIGYRLLHDRWFFVQFSLISFVFGFLGIGLGYWLSLLVERIF